VLEYFDKCAAFWTSHAGALRTWAADVRAGRIPDFGGNLRY